MKSRSTAKNSPPRNITWRAKDLADAGKTSAAIAVLEQGLQTYPDEPFFITQLGHLYRRLGNYEKALSYFAKGCQLEPNNMFNANSLGRILNDLGRHQDSETILQAAHQRNPRDVFVLNSLGVALACQNKNAEAVAVATKVRTLRPHDVITIILLGNLYLKQRSYGAFNGLMQQTSSLNITKTSYHYMKALGKFLQHEKEIARRAAHDALCIRIEDRAAILYMACAAPDDPGLADLRNHYGEVKYHQLLAKSSTLTPDADLLELIDPKFQPKGSMVTNQPLLYTRPVNRAAVNAVVFGSDPEP